jgi:hypothetical protein
MPGTAQRDVFRTLRTIHQEMPGTSLKYEWVKSHQDSQKPWWRLTLEEQINTMCDMLANGANTWALTLAPQHNRPTLLGTSIGG